MKRVKYLILSLVAVAFIQCGGGGGGGGGGGSSASCTNQENLASGDGCIAASILQEGYPFPSPIQQGSQLKLKIKYGAFDNNAAPITGTITTKVFSFNGQLVATVNSGSITTSAAWQDVVVWNNVSGAAGQYFLEVTINAGACGTKTICLADKRFNIV